MIMRAIIAMINIIKDGWVWGRRYYLRRPWKFFAECRRRIKWARQRVRQGYADCDLWAMDEWLFEVLPQAIRQFKETTHTYPGDITEEEWNSVLEEMAFSFEEAAQEPDFEDPEQYLRDYEYRKRRVKDGFDSLATWIFNLWD